MHPQSPCPNTLTTLRRHTPCSASIPPAPAMPSTRGAAMMTDTPGSRTSATCQTRRRRYSVTPPMHCCAGHPSHGWHQRMPVSTCRVATRGHRCGRVVRRYLRHGGHRAAPLSPSGRRARGAPARQRRRAALPVPLPTEPAAAVRRSRRAADLNAAQTSRVAAAGLMDGLGVKSDLTVLGKCVDRRITSGLFDGGGRVMAK